MAMEVGRETSGGVGIGGDRGWAHRVSRRTGEQAGTLFCAHVDHEPRWQICERAGGQQDLARLGLTLPRDDLACKGTGHHQLARLSSGKKQMRDPGCDAHRHAEPAPGCRDAWDADGSQRVLHSKSGSCPARLVARPREHREDRIALRT